MPTPSTGVLRVPRVIATDLDGTLLRSDGTLSERNREALRAVEDRGITVVFVTARPPRWLDELAHAVGGHGLVLCLNGACTYEVATRAVTDVRGFEHASVTEIIRDLRSGLPAVALGLERATGAMYDQHYRNQPLVAEEPARAPVEEHLDQPVGKLLARLPSRTEGNFFDTVRGIIGSRAILAYSGSEGLAEMTAPGVTKASALTRWCEQHNIAPSEVWAFGDMPNDLPMLNWAGRGIAVANAHPEVRTAITDRTASNDDDGVAQALEQLL